MLSKTLINIAQRLADFLAVLLSFFIGHWFYIRKGGSVPYTLEAFLVLGVAAGLMFLVLFQSLRLYERETSLLNVAETRRLIWSWLLGSLILFSSTFFFRVLDLSRVMVTASLASALFLLLIERAIFYRIHLKIYLSTSDRKAVIFGAGNVGRHLLKRIYHSPLLGIIPIGFLDDDAKLWGTEVSLKEIHLKKGYPVIGGMELLSKLKSEGLKEVFVALPSATYERNLEIVRYCYELGLTVSVVPPTYGRLMHHVDVLEIGGIPILREEIYTPKFYYGFVKRVFDLVVAALACILLSPVAILLAVLVKLDSPGPVFFKQKRVGLSGRQFSFYKFRSMSADANPYALTPQSAADPRLTKFGKWLRRSSLDELPQFLCVFKGDMSVVGPRPEMPFIVEKYNEEQQERLRVKPGITGIWQISAVRGEPIHANIEYDLFYIENQSILLDVIIVLKTIVGAIRGIGAF